MTKVQTATQEEIQPTPPPGAQPETFLQVMQALVGKVVTMVNPESFEDAPVGYRLTTGFYKTKVLAVGADYVTVATEFVRRRGEQSKEPVKQFIPLGRIKRVSLMKDERLVHL
jgi:hypothetical protein